MLSETLTFSLLHCFNEKVIIHPISWLEVYKRNIYIPIFKLLFFLSDHKRMNGIFPLAFCFVCVLLWCV